MGCGCNAKKKAVGTFVVKFKDGKEKVYRSETEAKMAVARKGGTYTKG